MVELSIAVLAEVVGWSPAYETEILRAQTTLNPTESLGSSTKRVGAVGHPVLVDTLGQQTGGTVGECLFGIHGFSLTQSRDNGKRGLEQRLVATLARILTEHADRGVTVGAKCLPLVAQVAIVIGVLGDAAVKAVCHMTSLAFGGRYVNGVSHMPRQKSPRK